MAYTREFTEARKAQGFKSAEDLGAFLDYSDHTEGCADCQRHGMPVFVGDGWQPTQYRCRAALVLWSRWEQVRDAA